MTGDPVLDSLHYNQRGVERVSPLYHRLLSTTIANYESGGICRKLLSAGPSIDPVSDALPFRFLGGVHRLVLQGAVPELAAHFPSVGGQYEPANDPSDAFLQVLATHAGDIDAALWRPVQTNEVGRCGALVIGLLEVAADFGLPLRLLELGASAGLNLRIDQYRYEGGLDGSACGPPDAPLRFSPYRDPLPDLGRAKFVVVERAGCDRSPVDATDPDDQLLLRSFVWPDQLNRLAQLDAALKLAPSVSVHVEKANATTWLPDRLAEPSDGLTTVVFHSIVWQYLSDDARRTIERAIDRRGKDTTADAPLAWLRLEPGDDPDRGAELRLTTWPGGNDRRLARSGYHGMPVRLDSPPAPS